ncbi:glycosyltransferase family A protein [Paraburkholderia tropica]|uniref:glycosyltransferase n=1 Tax=Paraburkholderia tropica TaxID=92647 RepID=UPI002AB6FBD0|nr:glycosyltransferase family A protein [Paraburkholderia tropica]
MIGVVIPAHNEAGWLGRCLFAAAMAARHVELMGESVCIVVVLDSCTDDSACVTQAFGATALTVQARNVGIARATGASHLIALGARWLAMTDADTCVAPDWIVAQLALRADVVCGAVEVDDWGAHPPCVRETWSTHYRSVDGHRHVHGANLGVSAKAYQRAGGFPPLACGEDVALVERLTANGARIAWSVAPRVTTSARTDFRIRGGFGDTLSSWSSGVACAPAGVTLNETLQGREHHE